MDVLHRGWKYMLPLTIAIGIFPLVAVAIDRALPGAAKRAGQTRSGRSTADFTVDTEESSDLSRDLLGDQETPRRQDAEGAATGSGVAVPEPITSTDTTDQPPSILPRDVTPIDLATALALVDVQNPQYLAAQQWVSEAVALQQLAAAQILPTINLGTSYDGHTGNLQQSSGNILQVKRNNLFVGAGANAIAAGSVNIPGVIWKLNVGESVFNYLQSRQQVAQRQSASVAARNDVGLRVVTAYLDLLEAEGMRSIGLQVRSEAAVVAKITADYAKAGQGRPADAERAATELRDRDANVIQAEGQTLRASARLAKLLSLDTSLLLHPTDNWVVPHAVVPNEIPLPELLAIALLQRPEMAERQADVERSLLALHSAKLLPFSPNLLVGFSAGAFGGGSNIASQPAGSGPGASGAPRFGDFGGRTDFDIIAYWTLRNLGVGNRAQILAAASRMRSADLEQLVVLDQVRADVAKAYVSAHARHAQIATAEQASRAAHDSWKEDLERIRGKIGLPIEVLDSLRLLARSRVAYLAAIVNYNRAEMDLYVALGQPPADALVRPAEAEIAWPPDEPSGASP